MRLSKPKTVLVVCAGLAVQLNLEASEGTYVDAQNLIEISVSPIFSTAVGYVAWQFGVIPLDATNEVSSIDAASGNYGFAGTAFRQVNPSGMSTVFTDFNAFFGEGEDETTDTQFTFDRASLTVVPATDMEDATQLKAAFTSFPPIRVDADTGIFAQVVTPIGSVSEFRGAFAIRPVGGGLAQLAEIGPISFSVTLGDFDLDGDLDGADFLKWQRESGNSDDLALWKAGFGLSVAVASTGMAVPEPAAWMLMLLAVMCYPVFRGCRVGTASVIVRGL